MVPQPVAQDRKPREVTELLVHDDRGQDERPPVLELAAQRVDNCEPASYRRRRHPVAPRQFEELEAAGQRLRGRRGAQGERIDEIR